MQRRDVFGYKTQLKHSCAIEGKERNRKIFNAFQIQISLTIIKTHSDSLTSWTNKSQVWLRVLTQSAGTLGREAWMQLRGFRGPRPQSAAAAQQVIYKMLGKMGFCWQTLMSM